MANNNASMYENHPMDSRVTGPLDVAPTVSKYYGTGGGNVPIVLHGNNHQIVTPNGEDALPMTHTTDDFKQQIDNQSVGGGYLYLCRASYSANAEMYENLSPCITARNYKDGPVVIVRRSRNG